MTCYDLKMSLFIAYLLNEQPRPADWDTVFSEYIGLRENKSSLFVLTLMKEIESFKAKYFQVEKICETLAVIAGHPDGEKVDISELTAMLKIYGFRAAYDIKNKSTFSRDLRAALSGAKKYITVWQAKEKELADYQKKYAGKEVQRKDFYVWAVTLAVHFGISRIDLEAICVAEWCIMMNQYEQFCEIKNAESHNLLNKNNGRR